MCAKYKEICVIIQDDNEETGKNTTCARLIIVIRAITQASD
jgi:hypothetical protein